MLVESYPPPDAVVTKSERTVQTAPAPPPTPAPPPFPPPTPEPPPAPAVLQKPVLHTCPLLQSRHARPDAPQALEASPPTQTLALVQHPLQFDGLHCTAEAPQP